MAKRRGPYGDKVRENIKTGMIVSKLQAHVEGTNEMSATQINAARILLGKVVPDQSAAKVENTVSLTDDTTPTEKDRDAARNIMALVANK